MLDEFIETIDFEKNSLQEMGHQIEACHDKYKDSRREIADLQNELYKTHKEHQYA